MKLSKTGNKYSELLKVIFAQFDQIRKSDMKPEILLDTITSSMVYVLGSAKKLTDIEDLDFSKLKNLTEELMKELHEYETQHNMRLDLQEEAFRQELGAA